MHHFLTIFILFSLSSKIGAFSDLRVQFSPYTCSILQEKCEWRQEWTKAEGVRRELDVGSPRVQFYHFCKTSNTKPCDVWVDEKQEVVNGTSETINLSGDIFIIENLGIHSTGIYYKFPEDKLDKKFIVE